jgi:hypothetical protein
MMDVQYVVCHMKYADRHIRDPLTVLSLHTLCRELVKSNVIPKNSLTSGGGGRERDIECGIVVLYTAQLYLKRIFRSDGRINC